MGFKVQPGSSKANNRTALGSRAPRGWWLLWLTNPNHRIGGLVPSFRGLVLGLVVCGLA
jgi:hypothetical protein